MGYATYLPPQNSSKCQARANLQVAALDGGEVGQVESTAIRAVHSSQACQADVQGFQLQGSTGALGLQVTKNRRRRMPDHQA